MVASVDGAGALGGTTRRLSSDADRAVFALLRQLADVILVGAGTVRAERYGAEPVDPTHAEQRIATGQSPAPGIAVVSRSLDLDPSSTLFVAAATRTIVITCTAAPPDRRRALQDVADVIDAGTDAVDVGAARGRAAQPRAPSDLVRGRTAPARTAGRRTSARRAVPDVLTAARRRDHRRGCSPSRTSASRTAPSRPAPRGATTACSAGTSSSEATAAPRWLSRGRSTAQGSCCTASPQRADRGADRAHGRTVLESQGRRRMDDPEGRVPARRRGPARGGQTGVRRGDRPARPGLGRSSLWGRSGSPAARSSACGLRPATSTPTTTVSGTFTMEWPPRSGELQEFPELDRAAWVRIDRARELIVRAQQDFLDRLVELVKVTPARCRPRRRHQAEHELGRQSVGVVKVREILGREPVRRPPQPSLDHRSSTSQQ